MLSVIVPISFKDLEAGLLNELKPSLRIAKSKCSEKIELKVIANPPCVGRVKAKNFGASESKGEVLVFLDADCRISESFLSEVSEKAKNDYFIGGGVKQVKLSKLTPGALMSLVPLGFYLLFKQITIGAFWVKREAFNTIGGFREVKYDDIDFALRLRQYALDNYKKFESIKKSYLVWSTRKFSMYGDWHWLRSYHRE